MAMSVARRYHFLWEMCQRPDFTVDELKAITGLGEKEVSDALFGFMREGKVDNDPLSGHGRRFFVTARGSRLIADEASSLSAEVEAYTG